MTRAGALGPEVMLASRDMRDPSALEALIGRLSDAGWWFELKFDGIRAVVTIAEGTVRITNRRRADITYRYPDVVEQITQQGLTSTRAGLRGLVLDGEIICSSQGRPDFHLAHLRDGQRSAQGVRVAMRKAPAWFIAFDVLQVEGGNVRGLPYEMRHALLAEQLPVSMRSTHGHDGRTFWTFAQSRSMEGLVAKRDGSLYRPGRQNAWVKIKNTRRISAIATGVLKGNGSRADFGALMLALWDPSTKKLVHVGNCGSGFTVADMKTVREALADADRSGPVVVEIEYLEASPDGKLRNPVFRGIRSDVEARDCVITDLSSLNGLTSWDAIDETITGEQAAG